MTPQIISLILQWSAFYSMDPYLVAAVVQTESSWDGSKIGDVGEVGLMQVRPTTAGIPAKKLKEANLNIFHGIKYLRYAKDKCKHQKNDTFVVCYNRGILGGRKMKSKPFNDDYYKKVMAARVEIKNQLDAKGVVLAY